MRAKLENPWFGKSMRSKDTPGPCCAWREKAGRHQQVRQKKTMGWDDPHVCLHFLVMNRYIVLALLPLAPDFSISPAPPPAHPAPFSGIFFPRNNQDSLREW